LQLKFWIMLVWFLFGSTGRALNMQLIIQTRAYIKPI
jgi:hypothetical protein